MNNYFLQKRGRKYKKSAFIICFCWNRYICERNEFVLLAKRRGGETMSVHITVEIAILSGVGFVETQFRFYDFRLVLQDVWKNMLPTCNLYLRAQRNIQTMRTRFPSGGISFCSSYVLTTDVIW